MGKFVYELSLPPGINADATTFSSQGRWVDGSNVRFFEGLPQTVGGENFLLGSLTGIYKIYNRNGSIVFTTANVIYLYQPAGSLTAITPTGWTANNPRMSYADWGSTLLLSPTGGALYQQSGTSAATVITQAPSRITAMLVTPDRQALALGTNETSGGTFNALCIRGCDLEDFTTWVAASTNNAFEHILEGTGSIVTAAIVGNYVAVLTDRALYMGTFIGDPSQTYRFDKIADNCGCIALDAAVVAEGVLYWLSNDYRLRRWIPGTLPQIVPCTVLNDFITSVTNTSKIFLSYYYRHGEIRITYPDTRDVSGPSPDCTRYISYCLQESLSAQAPIWYRGISYHTAVLDHPAFPYTIAAIIPLPPATAGITYTDVTTIGASWTLAAGDHYLGSGTQRVQVQRFVPDFSNLGTSIYLTISIRNRPQSPVVTKDYLINTNTQKLDFRESGMILSVQLHGGASGILRMGKPYFECVTLGGR